MLDSNPYPVLHRPDVLITVPWQPLDFLTNVSEMIKVFGLREIGARDHCLTIFCPHRTNKNSLQNYTDKKRKTTLLIESFFLHV